MTPVTSIWPTPGTSTMSSGGTCTSILPAMPEDPTALPARLLRGAAITSNDWLRDAGSSRLAASVHKLRRADWIVLDERVSVPTRDGGRMASVARYSLDPGQRSAARWAPEAEGFLSAVGEFKCARVQESV